MKIAIVYNRESKNVINLFGIPNREKYVEKTMQLISDALKKGRHNVKTLEGDKYLIEKLEQFMPRVLKGEMPGMVFNLSYGIQGQARYTHVPSILEMVGIPYLGSGPMAHSLALDKVVAKMIFMQNGLPTPDFAVLKNIDFEMPDIEFPLIIKPKNEAVSFGLTIVYNEAELREAANTILEEYKQAALVEKYIDGREINVGLLGNNPPEALPPVEIIFGECGPPIYTHEDKTHISKRAIRMHCPADISPEITKKAQELAIGAFSAIECYDCARVDMRLDRDNNLFILEINSLPSLGIGSSFITAAKHIGLDFADLVNRMVEVASARYFGTPNPPNLSTVKSSDKKDMAFRFLTQRRDKIESRLQEWCTISSRTNDPVGIRLAVHELTRVLEQVNMKPVEKFTDNRSVWMWETKKGFEGGTLIIGHVDIPLSLDMPFQGFRRDPEFLYGEGIGSSRAPLVMIEFVLRTLRSQKSLDLMPLGVLCYADEGFDVRYSEDFIREASKKAGQIIVLSPGNPNYLAISQRRGLLKYRLLVHSRLVKLGQAGKHTEAIIWLVGKLKELSELSSRNKRLAVSVNEVRVDSFPMLLPHYVNATLLVSYYDSKVLNETKSEIRRILGAKTGGLKWELEVISDRPPMKERQINKRLEKRIREVASDWGIPFDTTSSLWPSVSGLAPNITPVICGMGPVADHLYTPEESVQRISLIQRTMLLTQYLLKTV